MLWMFVAMLLIVALAALVVVYVAFPRRGQQVPSMPWVGTALQRGVARLPTLDNRPDGGYGVGTDAGRGHAGPPAPLPAAHRAERA